MCQRNIRRLTHDERDEQRYEELYAQIEVEERHEHDEQFGPAIKFKPDGMRVHQKTVARMQQDLVEF